MATGKNKDGTVAVITWGYKEEADFSFIQNFVNEFVQKYPNTKMAFHRLEWEDDEVLIITGEKYQEELFPDYCQNNYDLDSVGTIYWIEVERTINKVRMVYTEMGVAGLPALKSIIDPIYLRFCKGERTQNLYNEIMELAKDTL